jgi:N6-adenosine-specific RNA methylase IME4
MGRPPLKKSGPMTNAEMLRRRRRKVAREKKLANPKLVAKQERRAERERLLAGKILALPDKKYGVILSDPEWRFEVWSRETGLDRAADNHYSTSELNEIKSRDVKSIAADDCVLFLWATVPMLPQVLEVMAAWGFTYVSQMVWVKDRWGHGYWFRNKHEILLVGTRGKIPAPAPGIQWGSVIEAPRGAHSEKPDIVYDIIERYFPNLPKIELNARCGRTGWDSWGLEAPSTLLPI